MHDFNCFITLTYSPEYLPENGSLVRKDFTDFMKRLRKALGDISIRYFGCGEYGSKLERPHYHAIIFGYDFPDKKLFKDGKFPLFVSSLLEKCWPFGWSTVAAFSFESAAYVARYCVKKVTGSRSSDHYGLRIPEFSAMSLRPGIGYDFFIKYYEDIVNSDACIGRGGRQIKPPRYYDKLLSGCDFEKLQQNKERRQLEAKVIDPWRLQDLDKFNLIKFQRMMRKLEDGLL
ncbi:rolling circle replication-associated protein [Salmonella enterica]|uniref:rolling circle replication-associated protein n=1 Tax=Salmonella enterica TaxID=28901 RepID=UPI001590333E|nr:hypothetical protein [Salmonella enterica]